jgi:hypothetical protein
MVSARARSALALRRQKRPPLRQQFLNRRFEPHGHKSLSPRRSANSTSPPLMVRGPRFTRVSDGKPLRRLLIGSKGEGLLWICLLSWHGCLLALICFRGLTLDAPRTTWKDCRPAATLANTRGWTGFHSAGHGSRTSPPSSRPRSHLADNGYVVAVKPRPAFGPYFRAVNEAKWTPEKANRKRGVTNTRATGVGPCPDTAHRMPHLRVGKLASLYG